MEANTQANSSEAVTQHREGVVIQGQQGVAAGLKVSEAAVRYAKQRLLDRGTPNAAIRLGVRGGGCSGFSYVIEFSDDPPRERDSVGSSDGVTFYVDKKSLAFLNGSTLDYTKSLMFQGFQFLNPQEASKCGCGHSFTVK
jgi:iron-sulfur cluster assembly protein